MSTNRIHKVGLFGTATRSNTLLVIHMMGETHASEISRILDISLSQAQKAIDSLERAGIVVGTEEGRARRVRMSPRYAFAGELSELLSKMAMVDIGLQKKLSEQRRRPRRSGKPL